MAQTPEYYRDQILAQVMADSVLGPMFNPDSSAYDLFRRFCYAIGYVASVIDQLQDTLYAKIQSLLAAQQPHTAQWYQTKALLFMYGYDLPPYSDSYSPTLLAGLTPTQISNAQVVKFCAVEETPQGQLMMKVATLSGTTRVPITSDELTSFQAYFIGTNNAQIGKVKDAGVWMTFLNVDADNLDITYVIYFDPQTMNPDGTLIVDGSTPVADAINNYLNNLPFNGELKLADLDDAVQAAAGVTLTDQISVYKQALIDTNPVQVEARYVPYAGYFNVRTLNITYLPEP